MRFYIGKLSIPDTQPPYNARSRKERHYIFDHSVDLMAIWRHVSTEMYTQFNCRLFRMYSLRTIMYENERIRNELCKFGSRFVVNSKLWWKRTSNQIIIFWVEIAYAMLQYFNQRHREEPCTLIEKYKVVSSWKQFISLIQQVRHLVEMMTELIYKLISNKNRNGKNEK